MERRRDLRLVYSHNHSSSSHNHRRGDPWPAQCEHASLVKVYDPDRPWLYHCQVCEGYVQMFDGCRLKSVKAPESESAESVQSNGL